MTDVIDFFFQLLQQIWNLIKSQWILSASFLITVLGFVVDLVIQSRSQQ